MEQAPPTSTPPSPAVSIPANSKTKLWRNLCLTSAVAVLVGSSLWVWRYPSFRPDVEIPGVQKSLGMFAPGWWKNAIEFNATRRLPVLDGDLLSISFAPDGKHGWLLGAGNILLHTSDAGGSWTRVDRQSGGGTNNAAGSGGGSTNNTNQTSVQVPGAESKTARIVEPPVQGPLRPDENNAATRQLPDANPSIANRLQQTPIGQKPAGSAGNNAIQSPPILAGETAEKKGGGFSEGFGPKGLSAESFRARGDELDQVAFLDRKRGFGFTPSTALKTTDDGGQTWTGYQNKDGVVALTIDDEGTLCFVYQTHERLATLGTLNPRNASPSFSGAQTEVKAQMLSGSPRVVIADRPSALYVLDDNSFSEFGKTSQHLGIRQAHDLAYAKKDVFWIVGADGEAQHSTDRGKSWQTRTLPTKAALYAIDFIDEQRGWVGGANGVLLRTNDGGTTWWHAAVKPSASPASATAPYFWVPPPWWWLCVGLSLGLVRVAWRPPAVVTKTTVEDILLTDRPLEPGERDLLGHASRALGLSAFIRNTRTQPPLTLAITGEWGSGKSSLMNLLRGDLAHHGLRPVWFNAWHHQTEEHLLAALLANIRSQAVPPWWLPGGMAFRLRLLAKRVWREKVRWTLIAAAFLFFAGLQRAHGPWSLEQVVDQAIALWKSFLPSDPAEGAKPAAPNLPEIGGFTGLLVAVLLGLVQLLRALRAFGVEPASLLATQSNNPRLQDLEKQTSFRFHFAREFAEVTSSLGSRRMVIFIDDLDRCQPKQVYEMLESVNFLVSSGRCFIVLGLALERVERAVGLALADVADAENPSETKEEVPAETAKRRAEYARHYLGKLINIEVKVPTATTKNYSDLLKQRGQANDDTKPSRRFPSWLAVALSVIVITTGLVGIFDAGQRLGAPKPAASSDSRDAKNTRTPGIGDNGNPEATPAQTRGNIVAAFAPGAKPLDPWWIFGPISLALLGVVLWRWRAAAPVEETDSDEFSKSLDHWLPTAAAVPGATPRSLKRFVNRVRYYAMLQKSLFSSAEKIPEGKLVALAAYQERYPGEVEKSTTPVAGLPAAQWGIDESTYYRFRTLSVGVTFRADEPAPENASPDSPRAEA